MTALVTKEDMKKDLEEYKDKLKESPEVKSLARDINLKDSESIINLGLEPAKKANKVSDEILQTMKAVSTQEATSMLVKLSDVISTFKVKDFETEKEPKTFLGKIFKRFGRSIEKLYSDYKEIGDEVGAIHKELVQYEGDIKKTNRDLQIQYEATTESLKEIEKYIAAGELQLDELESYIKHVEEDKEISENQRATDLQELNSAKELLSSRILDLKLSENVALQSLPLIDSILSSNNNLLLKINSSVTTTLPIFKNGIIQAIQLKRQAIQSKSLQALSKTTSDLLKENAKTASKQTVEIAKQSRESVIDIDSLKQSFDAIKQGIEESKRIGAEASQKRKETIQKLEEMKADIVGYVK